MAEVPIAALKAVAERLDGLGLEYAFLGGAVVGRLLDQPELSPVRPTDDVDVVIEVVSKTRYSAVEEKLRDLGFAHDMRPGAPRCRWVMGNLTVDIMPAEGEFLGLNTAWFREALTTAVRRPVPGGQLRVVSPIGFLATKYAAFADRGAGDYYASHDLEDTLDASFCVLAVQRALDRFGVPEIFNTDQGCQFTSAEFTQPLLAAGVKLSMDGKGRCLDNVFVERLWRTVKYEKVYLKSYRSLVDAHAHLDAYFRFYNERRPHHAHAGGTPGAAYRAPEPEAVNQ